MTTFNITKVSNEVPAAFKYEYYDEGGTLQSVDIDLKLKRMTFRKITATKFTEAIAKINEHPEEVAELLCDIIDDWNITIDDAGTIFPITVDNIAEREPGFVTNLSAAVFERLFPNPQTAEKSPDGSAQKENTKVARSN